MDAISDDYYDEIHLKFLIAEYDRAKMDKQQALNYMVESKNNSNFLLVRHKYNKYVMQMKAKEKMLEMKIGGLCKLIGIDKPRITIKEKIK
jgi:hypothetical protein